MTVEQLRHQFETACAAIRELDDDLAAGRLSAADHADLKARSERQAAALLTRLRDAEQHAGTPPGERRAARAPGTLGALLRTPVALAIGAVVLAGAGVALGVYLGRSTLDERPAAVVAGPARAGGATPAASAGLDALRKEVEGEAAPTKKLLAFAHLALDEGQVPAAIWAYKRVLAREPKNAEAITHIGIILYQGNHVDQALARVEEAIAIDPGYAHAHWDRAQMLLVGKKDYAAAQKALEVFLTLVPAGEDADRARTMLEQARKQAGAGRRG